MIQRKSRLYQNVEDHNLSRGSVLHNIESLNSEDGYGRGKEEGIDGWSFQRMCDDMRPRRNPFGLF